MTSPSDNQQLESYVPVYDVVPENWEEARAFLVEQLKRLALAVNIREIGWFLDEELLSGKAFIPGTNNVASAGTSQTFRTVLRKVVDFGALPAAGTKSVPHGINFDANFSLTFLGGYATDPVAFVAFPLPYADPILLVDAVALTIDATNVNVTVGIDRSSFTRCFVTIEYIQEL
jgi:hypothetical protein